MSMVASGRKELGLVPNKGNSLVNGPEEVIWLQQHGHCLVRLYPYVILDTPVRVSITSMHHFRYA